MSTRRAGRRAYRISREAQRQRNRAANNAALAKILFFVLIGWPFWLTAEIVRAVRASRKN
jgi:hypothetical protein